MKLETKRTYRVSLMYLSILTLLEIRKDYYVTRRNKPIIVSMCRRRELNFVVKIKFMVTHSFPIKDMSWYGYTFLGSIGMT